MRNTTRAGDFESVLSFGVGAAKAEPFRMYMLAKAGQVVLDIRAPYWTVAPATAFGALQRLFAGPTQAEQARGLRFVGSGATGFKILSIRDGVARIQLTGKLSGGDGHTERPFGHSDSIPFSLEP